MGVIVSRGGSKLRCDSFACCQESAMVYGDLDGQIQVRRVMQKRGWQCSTSGKDYCPDHAFNRPNAHTVPAEHFCLTLEVNVDNKKLSDADFREFVRNTLPIVQKARRP